MLAIYRIQAILTDKSSFSLIPTLLVLTKCFSKVVLPSFVEFFWLYEIRCRISSLITKRQRRSWVCNIETENSSGYVWMLFQKSALLCLLRLFFFVTFYKHRLYPHSNDGLGFHCVPDKAACRATQEARCSKLYMVLLLTTTKWLPASAMLAAVLPLLPSVAHWGYAKSALSFFNLSPVSVPCFSSISASHSVHQARLSLFHILL